MGAWAVAIGAVVSIVSYKIYIRQRSATAIFPEWLLYANTTSHSLTHSLTHFILVYILYTTTQAVWNYYDNQNNTSESFSKEEQESWNSTKKAAATDKTK